MGCSYRILALRLLRTEIVKFRRVARKVISVMDYMDRGRKNHLAYIYIEGLAGIIIPFPRLFQRTYTIELYLTLNLAVGFSRAQHYLNS